MRSRPLRVLIVDDSPRDAELVLRELEHAGYEPASKRVETAAEMRAALADGAWEVVLSDNRLPEFDGMSALILARHADPDLPFVLVSATIGEEAAVEMMRAGADDFIPKHNLVRLSKTIERELRERESRRARRRAEQIAQEQSEALQRSEERHRKLVESIPHMIWTTTPEGLANFFSQRGLDTLGISPDVIRGWGWLDLLHPDDVPRARCEWQDAFRHVKPYASEFRMRHADGSYHWYRSQGVPVHGADDVIERWVGTVTDIDDRKRAETERDRLLSRLRLQIERMPLAYILTDADLRVTDWNPTAERIFGFRKDEVLGMGPPYAKTLPAGAWTSVEETLSRIRAGDMAAHWTHENLTKDGRTIICEWFNTPLFGEDGSFLGLISLASDITERRQAEEALALRDRAIQAVTQGILITDPNQPDNPVVYASPGFQRLTGYPAADIVGRNPRFLQGAETDPETVAQIRQAMADRQPCTVQLLNYRPDGTSFWNELSIAPVVDETGRLTHFVGVQTDVTLRRRLEEQYRHSHKMEAVGQLAGGVAHDFNNLLTVITGYSELLLERLQTDDPNWELVDAIRKAGERSASLTGQLLAFSRKQILAPRILDLNEVVHDTEKMLRRVISEDVSLATVLEPALTRVRADPGQIEQVLLNLTLNARDAMPKGGSLRIETKNVDIDARAESEGELRPGRYAMLSITDSGHGMSKEMQRHVFEPFFTTKEQGKGTGLGLAVVHGIVQQSDGHIEIESAEGVGTSFHIYLPSAESIPPLAGAPADSSRAPRGAETILLVEDEASVRALTRRILEGCGYNVLAAAEGNEALRICTRHREPIQLLVTDVVMPGMDGPTLAKRLLVLRPEMRVLYLSGYTDDAVMRHGILEEEVNFMQKPFSSVALAQKVREVLTRD